MDITAKQISTWVVEQMQALLSSKVYQFKDQLYKRLADESGLSYQTVRQFHRGKHVNLSVENLDALVAAVKNLQSRLRAA